MDTNVQLYSMISPHFKLDVSHHRRHVDMAVGLCVREYRAQFVRSVTPSAHDHSRCARLCQTCGERVS